jgi:hypothetical protein
MLSNYLELMLNKEQKLRSHYYFSSDFSLNKNNTFKEMLQNIKNFKPGLSMVHEYQELDFGDMLFGFDSSVSISYLVGLQILHTISLFIEYNFLI